jgi:hypothetical protein
MNRNDPYPAHIGGPGSGPGRGGRRDVGHRRASGHVAPDRSRACPAHRPRAPGAAVGELRHRGRGGSSPVLPRSVAGEPPGLSRTFSAFWQAWGLVQQHYVDRQAADATRMTYGAIEGMLDSLDDTGHTRFLSPSDVRDEAAAPSGRLEGVGAEVALRNGELTIVAPLAGQASRPTARRHDRAGRREGRREPVPQPGREPSPGPGQHDGHADHPASGRDEYRQLPNGVTS